MQKVFALILELAVFLSSSGQYNTILNKFYSKNVKDSFELYISSPGNYTKQAKYDIVYYCDANLKSGKKLRELISGNQELSQNRKIIFVGIGHIGDYHVLRRRDFILPFIVKGDTLPKSGNYGHIQDFYKFLNTELFPAIEPVYNFSGRRSIIGHSLGGLFVFYCLFRNEGIFTDYFALSPALWIDGYEIYHFNNIKNSLDIKSYLYLSAGSRENLNHILKGADQMNNFLKRKNYKDLDFEYKVHYGKTHNTQVLESLKYILQKLL